MEIIDYIFDIDETICHQKKKNHKNYYLENLIPNKDMIIAINKLYDKGNRITIMTGRGAQTGIDWTVETERQLREWKIKYNELKFIKKPLKYLYVDDKACSPKEFLKLMKNAI